MKIVILGTRGFPGVQGGVEKHCECLAVNLVKLGCDVVVFTREPYVKPAAKEFKGVKLVSLPAVKHRLFEAFFHTFIGVFAALFYRPDILHIQAIGPGLFTPLARILGLRVVLTSHGANYEHRKWGRTAKFILKAGEILGVYSANEIICVSKTIGDGIRRKYNREATVIPNGIDIPEILESGEFLNRYSLVRGKYALAVGRFVPEKGFDYLIDAFSRASLEGWKLVIAGSADHETRHSRELRDKAAKYPNIVLPGFLTGRPLEELYSQAGLFVLPSYYEGMPIVLLEAMSYGLVCLASGIAANLDIGLPKDNYFPPGDAELLAGKLRAFSLKKLTKEESLSQIKDVREKYSWEDIAFKTIQVYKKAISRRT